MATLLVSFSTIVEVNNVKNLSLPNLETLLAEVSDIRVTELANMYEHFDKSLASYFQVLSLDVDEHGARTVYSRFHALARLAGETEKQIMIESYVYLMKIDLLTCFLQDVLTLWLEVLSVSTLAEKYQKSITAVMLEDETLTELLANPSSLFAKNQIQQKFEILDSVKNSFSELYNFAKISLGDNLKLNSAEPPDSIKNFLCSQRILNHCESGVHPWFYYVNLLHLISEDTDFQKLNIETDTDFSQGLAELVTKFNLPSLSIDSKTFFETLKIKRQELNDFLEKTNKTYLPPPSTGVSNQGSVTEINHQTGNQNQLNVYSLLSSNLHIAQRDYATIKNLENRLNMEQIDNQDRQIFLGKMKYHEIKVFEMAFSKFPNHEALLRPYLYSLTNEHAELKNEIKNFLDSAETKIDFLSSLFFEAKALLEANHRNSQIISESRVKSIHSSVLRWKIGDILEISSFINRCVSNLTLEIYKSEQERCSAALKLIYFSNSKEDQAEKNRLRNFLT